MLQPVSVSARSSIPGVPDSRALLFNVYMEGDKVGQDRITFDRTGDTLTVKRFVELNYSYAYINFLDYTHESRGQWHDGRLIEVEGRTNNNGKTSRVKAHREGEEMVITKGEQPERRTGTVLPTSWWNPKITEGHELLDTQFGRFRSVSVKQIGETSRRKGDETVAADEYQVSGDLNLKLWYGPQDELVGIEFERKGYQFTYERIK